jgi:hypothetical protein
MNKYLTWRELKALNDIYVSGSTTARIQHHPYIRYLKDDLSILSNKLAYQKILQKKDGFDPFYEVNHLDDYQHYYKFLFEKNILNHCSRYDEDDIRVLILIDENKNEILKSLTTQRSFSAMFFDKGSKHLEKHPGLEKAILVLLGIPNFPDKDPKNNQFRYIVDCKTKKVIVLCENLNFLKSPWKARDNDIELWYVGGNNIVTLTHINTEEIKVPIFYSCDWDYDGLIIFQRIKEFISSIKLLIPFTKIKKPTSSDNHNSFWKQGLVFSGLDYSFYDNESIELINQLILNDEWIEEESNDLLDLLKCIGIGRDRSL